MAALTLLDQIPILGYYANSADPVQMPQNMVSDQCKHCLQTGQQSTVTMKIKHQPDTPKNKWTHPTDKDGQIHR